MCADDGEVRHANLTLVALLHETHAFDAALMSGETNPNFVEKPPVNLINNLEMAGKKDFKPRGRPFLQSFRQQSVICVSQRLLRQIPSPVPSQVRIIQQNSH